MTIQGWFPLGLTGLISLQSKWLSRVFSNSTVKKHKFFSAQPFILSSSHICTWLPEKPQLWLWTFVGKVMSLLFNTMSMFVINFLPEASGSRWWSRRTCAHLLWEHHDYHRLLNNRLINRRMLEPTKKRYPMSKDKEAAVRQCKGHSHGQIKSLTHQRVTHRLENSNPKEVLPLLWWSWTPHQASQPGGLTKGLGIPRNSGLEG